VWRWMPEAASALPVSSQQRADMSEIAAPQKEAAKLEAERDIPQKAAAFFSRRPSSAMLSSPRRPSSTMRIFSSAECCFRVRHWMSFTTISAGALDGSDFNHADLTHGR